MIGKGIFSNIQNFLTFQLSTSVAALSLVALSTTLGLPNPLNAMQILWINILMDGPPAQSLGVEPVDPAVMLRPPRQRDALILTAKVIKRVLTQASIILIGTMAVYVMEMNDGKVTARDTTMVHPYPPSPLLPPPPPLLRILTMWRRHSPHLYSLTCLTH